MWRSELLFEALYRGIQDVSDDALASILAWDIENNPAGACQNIDNFCRTQKCSDDIWMNIAVKLGVQNVLDSKKTRGWTWRDTIRWWCEVLCHKAVTDRFFAAAKHGLVDFMSHITGDNWQSFGTQKRSIENTYYYGMCIAASWGRVQALDWLNERWESIYKTTLASDIPPNQQPIIDYSISYCAGFSGDVATLEWCQKHGMTGVGQLDYSIGYSGSQEAINWWSGNGGKGWETLASGAAASGNIDTLDFLLSPEMPPNLKNGADLWQVLKKAAATNGDLQVLYYLNEKYGFDERDWRQIFVIASENGRVSVMKDVYRNHNQKLSTLYTARSNLLTLKKQPITARNLSYGLKFRNGPVSTLASQRAQREEASKGFDWIKEEIARRQDQDDAPLDAFLTDSGL